MWVLSESREPGLYRRRFSSLHSGAAGFGLVILLLSLVIVACVVILSVREVHSVRERSRCEALVRELTAFEQAFQLYADQKRGVAPASALPGQIPAGMDRLLGEGGWRQASPFGGHYRWISPCPEAWLPKGGGQGGMPLGAIALTAFAPDAPLSMDQGHFAEIQEQFELSSRPKGKFRSGFNGWPILLVYPRP